MPYVPPVELPEDPPVVRRTLFDIDAAEAVRGAICEPVATDSLLAMLEDVEPVTADPGYLPDGEIAAASVLPVLEAIQDFAVRVQILEEAIKLNDYGPTELFRAMTLGEVSSIEFELGKALEILQGVKKKANTELLNRMEGRGLNPVGRTTIHHEGGVEIVVTETVEKDEAPDFQAKASQLWDLCQGNPRLKNAARAALSRVWTGKKVPMRKLQQAGGEIGTLANALWVEGEKKRTVKTAPVKLTLDDGAPQVLAAPADDDDEAG